jgi:hypothetical protein
VPAGKFKNISFFASFKSLKKGVGSELDPVSDPDPLLRGLDPDPNQVCHGSPTPMFGFAVIQIGGSAFRFAPGREASARARKSIIEV